MYIPTLNNQDSNSNSAAFYQAKDFAFTRELEANWRQIAKEYQGIKEKFLDWFERDLYGE